MAVWASEGDKGGKKTHTIKLAVRSERKGKRGKGGLLAAKNCRGKRKKKGWQDLRRDRKRDRGGEESQRTPLYTDGAGRKGGGKK